MRLRPFPIALSICAALASLQPGAAQQKVTIVQYVQIMAGAGNFAAAEKGLDQYRGALGMTPEYLDALSWIGRGQLGSSQLRRCGKERHRRPEIMSRPVEVPQAGRRAASASGIGRRD